MVYAEPVLAVGLVAVVVWAAVAWIRRPDGRPRTLAVGLFASYLVIVLAATMFPIDTTSSVRSINVNWIPLRGILTPSDISRVQAIPNIALGIPFGFGVFFVANRLKPWQGLVAGGLFFLGVEVMQLLEVVLFPGSPRTTDINDIMLNTMGVVLGILGYVVFADWFRSEDARRDLGDSMWVEYLRSVTDRS